MERNLVQLTENIYDLLVIGGGIYGACVAWDATLRGLSVAMIEKADFGSATSANSLKIIHGGFRYLQHGDFKRMRESICERRSLMQIAPHLVHPLPVLIPTYGHWTQRKGILALALAANDLIGFDRNRLLDPEKHIPSGRTLSKSEVLGMLPNVPQQGLDGGMLFHDAQVYNSERLLLSFVKSADEKGATLANYVKVTGFLRNGESVIGVRAEDTLNGETLEIRARTVVNTAGPWLDSIVGLLSGRRSDRAIPKVKAVNIVTRRLPPSFAVGLSSKNEYRDANAMINKGNRFLFLAPWRDYSLIGTSYSAYHGDPDDFDVTQQDVQELVEEVDRAWPEAGLSVDDVRFTHGGLLPGSGAPTSSGDVQLANHYQIRDHRLEGVPGLISVTGVKYTTARQVAEKVVDLAFALRGQGGSRSATGVTPLCGGDIGSFEKFLQVDIGRISPELKLTLSHRLLFNYGTAYERVLRSVKPGIEDLPEEEQNKVVWQAEVLHAVKYEMAQKLSDVVFRRTELGSAGHPGYDLLHTCADVMGAELGWSAVKIQQEIVEVEQKYQLAGVTI